MNRCTSIASSRAGRLAGILVCQVAGALLSPAARAASVEVVTTLSPYAAIAREVGGDLVHVQSIARGDEDGHFVKPKPSFALMLRSADLFVTTGLDLEAWAPVLVDKSGNRAIREGSDGYVNASHGVPLLDVPASTSRSAGDVHIFGNPHVFTSPLNAKIVAANIAAGLKRVDPSHAADYQANLARFRHRIDVALYGEPLLHILGVETLEPLARQGKLLEFLGQQQYQGRPLLAQLGGWLGRARVCRGRKLVTYHKNWIYLTELLGLQVVDYVEPKPGIPPSARHVHDLIAEMAEQKISVLLAANYFSKEQIDAIATRTQARAVVVPMGPGEEQTYFQLVDQWIDGLAAAFAAAPPS